MNKKNIEKKINKDKNNNYSAKDIQVLKPIEAVQQVPWMYTTGVYHLFGEILANSVDEYTAGYCKKIIVILSKHQDYISVEDDGRGIPIEEHPKTKKGTLETIFTILHSGGKFDSKLYKTSGGLHGVGVTVVNALSENLEVKSYREKKIEILNFSRGKLLFSKIINTSEEKNGVSVKFIPDKNIFKDFIYFESKNIKKRLEELSYLNSQLTLYFKMEGDEEEKKITYYQEGGLASWVQKINEDVISGKTKICYEKWTKEDEKKKFRIDIAFQYLTKEYGSNNINSFCNNIRTSSGGTHVDGFELGLLKTCQIFIEKKNPNILITKEDVMDGITVIISILINNPEFIGQSKDRLANKEVKELTKKATQEIVEKFFQDNSKTAELIFKKIIENFTLRAQNKKAQDILKDNKEEENILPGILTTSEKREEIFLVEGQSAGGSTQEGRDVETQDALALQGKPPNALKSNINKIIKNNELGNILNVLGFGGNFVNLSKNNYNNFRPKIDSFKENGISEKIVLSEDFYYLEKEDKKIIKAGKILNLEDIEIIIKESLINLLKKSRYKKIIIMADPDDDGRHIAILIITFIFKYLPYLIEGNKLFVAVPPLYRIQKKKEIHYLYDEKELKEFHFNNKENIKIERIKGLGQMDPNELWDSTMNPEKRRLYNLKFSSFKNSENLIQELMGIKSIGRKNRLESGEHKNSQLIIEEEEKVDVSNLVLFNFLRYAFTVIENRAFPNVNDGLKPVQRRILYTLYQLGLTPDKSEATSGKVVGEVLGNWHPHGDQSIYNAMTNMVRKDKFRYPLVYGRGNFGYDKNPPAHMRYTKVRLTNYSLFLLKDLIFNTVNWQPNYDDSRKEPDILPSSIPNLLLNGSSGIAVGMSTNIPPHNLSETLNATIALINNSNLNNEDLINIIPGPDFPTGGIILEKEKISQIYEKGEGTIYLRAKAEIISSYGLKNKKNDKFDQEKKDTILITELPYKTSESDILENVNNIIKNKKIEGLKSINSFSNREGIKILISFNSNYEGITILNKLYKSTKLQISFSIKMRALIEKKPKIFSLKEILEQFIIQKLITIKKKSKFILEKNEKDLDNFKTKFFIINNYEKIIEIIRKNLSEEEKIKIISENFLEIKKGIIKVNSVLDMPINFRQFTPEQQKKLEFKINDIKEENKKLELIIENKDEREKILISELENLKNVYKNDKRRSEIIDDSHIIDERKSIISEKILVILSHDKKENNFLEKNKKEIKIENFLNVYKSNSIEATNIRSFGKELKTRGKNFGIIESDRIDDIWCFSNLGKIYLIPSYKLNDKSNNLRENDLARLSENEFIEKILPVRGNILNEKNKKEKYLIISTKKGKIKKISLEKINKISQIGRKIINIFKHQDNIVQVSFSSGSDYISIYTKKGKMKIFSENKIKTSGRASYGDNAIKLTAKDKKNYCQNHFDILKKHKTSQCCDKTQGIKIYFQCLEFKKIIKEIKECSQCNNFDIKDQDEVIGMSIISQEKKLENIKIFAIKKNNNLIKKSLLSVLKLGKKGGRGKKIFKIEEKKISKYCDKHEKNWKIDKEKSKEILEKLKENKKNIYFLKEIIEKSKEENEELTKKYEQDLLDAKKKQKEIKTFIEKNEDKKNFFKEKTKICLDCKKNCDKHELLKINHEKENCCNKKDKEINIINEKIKKIESEDIKEKKKIINKYKKKYKELFKINLKNRINCFRFRKINQEIKECLYCKKQREKKSIFSFFNEISKVFVTDVFLNSEIYLLSEELVCLYNKKDLINFLQENKKKKIQFYKENKNIIDIFFLEKKKVQL